MLARKVQSLKPVTGLDGPVAVRIEKVMKELHVEFVILNDENCLGARVHAALRTGGDAPRPWFLRSCHPHPRCSRLVFWSIFEPNNVK